MVQLIKKSALKKIHQKLYFMKIALYDLRNEPNTFTNSQFGGGSLKKSGVFENNIIYDLHIMRIYCRKFFYMLEIFLVPYFNSI